MQVFCSYSGLPIYKTPYLLGFDLVDIHPIFRAKRKLLLTPDIVHRFSKSQAQAEKTLLFLAVLNATELVEFRTVAKPSMQVLENNFYKLMHAASWLQHAEYQYKMVAGFPQFVISEETQDLSTIGNWLASLEDIKDQIIKRDIDRDRAAWLSAKEDSIRKELGEAAALNRAFTPQLARWALDYAELKKTDDRYSRWLKILCAPLKESVWLCEIDELRDIEEFLECELPSDHPQVISVMAQVRLLIKEHKRGFTDFAIFTSDGEDAESGFEILEDATGGGAQINKHLIDVPTSEPLAKDYPTKIAFLTAQAKWKLSKLPQPQAPVRKFLKPSQPTISSEDI